MKAPVLFALALLTAAVIRADEPPPIRAVPTRPPEGPAIAVKDLEVMPDCAEDKVCADGTVQNYGQGTAYLVRLKVELGGTKYGKPRTYFVQQLERNQMEPGESQDFSLQIDRKFPYTDVDKKDKIMEVGRYNFRVIPVWASSPAATPKSVKR